jgi:phenylacetate-coenzyme A ligase PaaK-like adenylate-forming protein
MGMCRQNDLIRMPPGKRVHPAFFNRLLYGLTQIRHYQWVQTAPDCIALNLVCPEKLDAHTITSLSESIRRELGEGVRLEVNHVDEIRRTASGKHRFVVGLD